MSDRPPLHIQVPDALLEEACRSCALCGRRIEEARSLEDGAMLVRCPQGHRAVVRGDGEPHFG